jgi:hypothetical protein
MGSVRGLQEAQDTAMEIRAVASRSGYRECPAMRGMVERGGKLRHPDQGVGILGSASRQTRIGNWNRVSPQTFASP